MNFMKFTKFIRIINKNVLALKKDAVQYRVHVFTNMNLHENAKTYIELVRKLAF